MMHRAETVAEKAVMVAYLASKFGTTPQALVGNMPFEVGSVIRDGSPKGAVLYTNFRGHSIEMSVAGEPGWITRGGIQAAFHYPFVQLGVWNVLTMVDRRHSEAREVNRRIGFTELCVIEAGTGDRGDDTILYGMTRDKCFWLKAEQRQPTHHLNGGRNGLIQ